MIIVFVVVNVLLVLAIAAYAFSENWTAYMLEIQDISIMVMLVLAAIANWITAYNIINLSKQLQ